MAVLHKDKNGNLVVTYNIILSDEDFAKDVKGIVIDDLKTNKDYSVYDLQDDGSLILNKTFLIKKVESFIDSKLDKLQYELLKNETYFYLPTYVSYKESKQQEIKTARELRQSLEGLTTEQLEAIINGK